MSSIMVKTLLYICVAIVLIVNASAFYHVFRFTHFRPDTISKSKNPEQLLFVEKLRVLIVGVAIPKPVNTTKPPYQFQTVVLDNGCGHRLQTWLVESKNSKGTVILFHGYIGNKSDLVQAAEVFYKRGYNTLLVDFPGHGGSSGTTTTIGYNEAQDVVRAFNYVRDKGGPVILYGESMGAVAIMRATSRYGIKPQALILECPFSTLLRSVGNRFRVMGMPESPFSELLVFWGSIQSGKWLFAHNTINYASSIKIPTLMMYGENDTRVGRDEIDTIYSRLLGKKELVVFENAGHEQYIKKIQARGNARSAHFYLIYSEVCDSLCPASPMT